MTMFRMPIFTWNILITSVLVLMVFPPLAAALLGLGCGPKIRHTTIPTRERGADALATPVLVLRPP